MRGMLSGTDEVLGEVPASLLKQQHGVCPRRYFSSDLSQMRAHCLGGAARHDQRRSVVLVGADRSEDVMEVVH